MTPALRRALAALARHPRVLVALDLDGTLAPLVDDPAQARPTAAGARALLLLAADPGVRLALVSGRPARDLAALASAPPGTLLVGSHGAERGVVRPDGGAEVVATALTAQEEELRARLLGALAEIADGRPGVWVEDKPFAAALHTRRAAPADARRAQRLALAGPGTWSGVNPLPGKDVVELTVREATKGDALLGLVAEAPAEPVLLAGDDVTDEHAFEVLGPLDVGVKVGQGRTRAGFHVADPGSLGGALEAFAGMRRGN